MITIQNADKALKEYYLQAVSAQLNDGISPFYSAIEKNANSVYGKEVKLAVVRGACGNIMAGDEDGDLPDPHKNRYINITAPLKNIYGTIEISDKAIRASRDSAGAFVNLLNAEMEGLIASAKQNFQRMLYGDGTGFLADITDKKDISTYMLSPLKEYMLGMQVDCTTSEDTFSDQGVGVYIEKIDRNEGTAKFSALLLDNPKLGKVYVHGSRDKELTGLGAIFGNGDLYGNSREEEPYLVPYTADLGGTLTEEGICDAIDFLEENFNSKINMILCSFKTRKKIAALISDERRVVNTIDAATGTGAVTVNGIPVYADKYCPEDTIYLLNTEDFSLNQLCDWEWLEDEEGKILRQIPGKAAYTATLVKYAELICKKPCGQGKLFNLG